jgi:predicted permease
MELNLSGPRYEQQEEVRDFYTEALEGIEALPGVRHAAAVSRLPLEGGTNSTAIIEGREGDFGEEKGPLVEVKVITPDYFDAAGIPLLAGRTPTEQDSSLGRPGVVINQTLAERAWPDESPLGKRFTFAPPHWVTVVGVVGDTRQWGLEREAIPEAYFPYSPRPTSGMFSFERVRFLVIRSDGEPSSLVSMVRREISSIDADQPVANIRTTEDILDASIGRRHFNTLLIVVFASVALVLVAAGIYGLMSYFVSQRTHEIGIRMALGADSTRVLSLVLGRGLKLAVVGVGLGLAGVAASTKLTAGMLYGVTPTEPVSVAVGTLFLLTVSLPALLVPARRATGVAPTTALRDE